MSQDKQVQQPALPLQVNNISKTFQVGKQTVTALNNLSFSIQPGIVTGLIGADGAGKTTLMRLATGLLVPDSGSIFVHGVDATVKSLTIQSTAGYMPQRFGLYEDLTVQENLELYADLQGLAKQLRSSRYEKLMEMTGMYPFTKRLAGRLSGGMKQKLGLACTLIKPPQLLLLDEPTVGVDPVSRRELWSIVYKQVEEEKMTVLLSTAYLDEAERCEEVILLHEGEMLGKNPPAAFSKQWSGHTFEARSTREKRRRLQIRLSQNDQLLDAIILGDHVRLVSRSPLQADILARLVSTPEHPVQITAVQPRFEDAFIGLLHNNTATAASQSLSLPVQITRTGQKNVIVVNNLERKFGDFYAVKDLSFSVQQGEIFGLLGANGAGKSTTFRMLCGLLPASNGSLEVAGKDLRRAQAPARGRIGYMAQRFSLYAGMSVMQNLLFFSSAYGLFGKKQKQRIQWALETFELSDIQTSISGELPLGYKQRLALAVALMHGPEILFLDEPTSGVDPLARREFWKQINALAEAGVTILVTTHFMEEAEYCDRLVIMASGQVLAAGDPLQLKQDVATQDMPRPTMEDAFISLIEQFEEGK